MALTSYFSNYSNLSLSDASSYELSSSIDVEFGFRIHSIFTFTFVYSKFAEPSPTESAKLQSRIQGAGMGMKIDLPGFFFLGAQRNDSAREGKKYPVNSFIFGEMVKFDTVDIASGSAASLIVPKYGIGSDIFLFNPTAFLSLRFNLLSYAGDTFTTLGAGLGAVF